MPFRAKTGAYRWHYQEVPEEDWDYTCTQSIVQADLTIDGKPRKVLMHAPKNGFFYVIDRTNGQFISAKNHVPVTWTTGFDANGRPIMNPEAHYGTDPVLVAPGPGGGHNWFPMAFNPQTGLAYFPQYEHWFVYALDPNFKPQPFRSNGNTFDCAVGDFDNDGDLDGFLGEIAHHWAGEASDPPSLLINQGEKGGDKTASPAAQAGTGAAFGSNQL